MINTGLRSQNGNIFVPRKREGTKTFLDVPMELRKKDFNSPSGKFFMKIFPEGIKECFQRAILKTGIESEDTFWWLRYVLAEDEKGEPVSPITQWVYDNPYNPRVFKYLYGEDDALSEMDKGFIFTPGASAIYDRLQSMIDRLPQIIRNERRRLKLKAKEKYVIYNIGSAYGLDTIYMMAENPELMDLVKIVHIDPDAKSLLCGQRYAKKLGIEKCFEFLPSKIEEANVDQAHMLLFIGMFCPVPTKKCVLTLKFISKFLLEDGLAIFSTVQEKMLMDGPILDFIMWTCGWRMYFKSDQEPGQIARFAGLVHEDSMDWEDEPGHNRMTVARKPKRSFWGSIGKSLSFTRAMLFM